MKNCDRGQHFQARGHSFSRTDPGPANSMFIFFFPAVNWFTDHKWISLRNFVIDIGLRAVYERFVKNLRNERVIQIPDVLKKRCFSIYFMIVAFISPGKFSQNCFSGVKFRAKCEVFLGKQFV